MRGLVSVGLLASGVSLAQSGSRATCFLPIDVYFVQDTTGSFIPDLPVVKAQIPEIINRINLNNPGSRFGVAEFRDKPYLRLGELNDYCYKRNHPLSTDVISVQEAFGKLFASGGGDLPEAQFQAIIDAVNDPEVGWRPLSSAPGPNEAGARLIIMSTDATPHDPGDYELYPGTAPAYMPPFPDNVAGITSDTLCKRYDYPTEAQVKAQLDAHSTYFAILTPRNNPDMGKAAARWREINDVYLGNPSGFFQYIEAGSADLVDALLAVLDNVTQYVCNLSTPPPPETSATTAATETTTVATETTTVATETTTVATETTTVATEPSTVATETTTVATEPTTVATETTTVATEPTTVATETTTVATEPTTVATETTTVATEPTTVATETTTVATEPTTVATETTTAATETTTAATETTTPLPPTTSTTTEEPDVTVTPVAPTEASETSPQACPPPINCPQPCPNPCVNKYGLYVKVNDAPQKLTIDYVK